MTDPIPGTPGFVERLLADRIGLDVASVGPTLVERGVRARMERLGVRRREDYERILLGPAGEAQALIEEVVIPESWFFRDDRPFAAFRQLVRDGWAGRHDGRALSVLCLPCAGGEEPYSVAIALLELGIPRERFEVVAVDISERSLRRAQAGLYGENAFRGIDPGLRDRYFDPAEGRGRYLIKASIRSAVRFEQGNVLDPNLLAGHAGFDVVFCRNLLIYLDAAGRDRAFANLARLVAPGGTLFLGHADRPDPQGSARFAPLGDRAAFAYRRCAGGAAPASSPAPAVPTRSAPAATPSPPAIGQRLARAAIRFARSIRPGSGEVAAVAPPATRSAPARLSPPAAPPAPPAADDAALVEAQALADRGDYEAALRVVTARSGRAPMDAPGHFLLGVIRQAAGDRVRAEAEFTKAVYLDPEHDEALLALALLARRRGDVAAEAGFRRRAERVLARKGGR